LDANHQRIGKKQRPQQIESKLRTCLGIGGNAAGVVICSAGNQARSEFFNQESFELGFVLL
jgi:hypothetical protein